MRRLRSFILFQLPSVTTCKPHTIFYHRKFYGLKWKIIIKNSIETGENIKILCFAVAFFPFTFSSYRLFAFCSISMPFRERWNSVELAKEIIICKNLCFRMQQQTNTFTHQIYQWSRKYLRKVSESEEMQEPQHKHNDEQRKCGNKKIIKKAHIGKCFSLFSLLQSTYCQLFNYFTANNRHQIDKVNAKFVK